MADRGDSDFGNGGGIGNAQEEFETDDIEEKFAALGGIPLDPRVEPIAKKYPTAVDLEEALETGEFKSLPLKREELRREWWRWHRYSAKREREKEAEHRAAKLSAQRQQIEAVLGGEEPNTRPIVPIDENRWPWVLKRAECLLLAQGEHVGLYRNASGEFLQHIVRANELPTDAKAKGRPPDDDFLPEHGVWRPPDAVLVNRVTLPTLQNIFERHLQFRKNVEQLPCDCPEKLAKRYLGNVGRWQVPALRGVITAPLVRADGSLLLKPGFDQQTGLYLDSDGDWLAPVATDGEALARAKAILLEPLAGFPISDQEKSVVVAAQLTGLERRLLASAPAFAIDSSIPSAGKSLLSDYILKLYRLECLMVRFS